MSASKYSPEIVAKIIEMIETDSYTIPEICKHVGISEATYHYWKDSQIEFLEAIKRAKQKYESLMLKECEKSLKKLVVGYEYEEVTTETKVVGETESPAQNKKVVKKHVAPNLGAIIHYQTNKDPENWKNRQSTESNVKLDAGLELDPEKGAKFIESLKKD